MKITVNTRNVEKIISKLDLTPKQVAQVSKLASNRVINMTKTDMKRKVREKYTAKAGEVAGSMSVIKSPIGGIIKSSGTPLPLTAFKLNPAKVGRTKKKLTASIKKGGLKPISKGFLIQKGAFQRKTDKRYPIKLLHGPSSPQMLGEQSILDDIEEKVMENMEKRITHEIGRILK